MEKEVAHQSRSLTRWASGNKLRLLAIKFSATLLLFGCERKSDDYVLPPLEKRLYSWHIERLEKVRITVNAETSVLDVIDQLNSQLGTFEGVTQIQISASPNMGSVSHQLNFLAQPISWSIPGKQFRTWFLGDRSGVEILESLETYQVYFNSIVNDEGAIVLVNHSTHFPSESTANESEQPE